MSLAHSRFLSLAFALSFALSFAPPPPALTCCCWHRWRAGSMHLLRNGPAQARTIRLARGFCQRGDNWLVSHGRGTLCCTCTGCTRWGQGYRLAVGRGGRGGRVWHSTVCHVRSLRCCSPASSETKPRLASVCAGEMQRSAAPLRGHYIGACDTCPRDASATHRAHARALSLFGVHIGAQAA
jgi:hypothetical protein